MRRMTPTRCLAAGLLATVIAFAGCAHAPPDPEPGRSPLAQWVPSENFDVRRPVIVVLHATEQGSVDESLRTLRSRNVHGKVSAHYLVGRDGAVYQLVDEADRAWHAGGGHWGTIDDLNSTSIGIELDNDGRSPFPDVQIDALVRLMADVMDRQRIERHAVIAHADMAPSRKRDPGHLFPWQRLAAAGFGVWPEGPLEDPPEGFDAVRALYAMGYPTGDLPAAVRAFHRRFRGIDDGDDPTASLDDTDARILHALTRPAAAASTNPL
jgi:N-acetyl-anhydromuramyl-L-alanine amidase AmpD